MYSFASSTGAYNASDTIASALESVPTLAGKLKKTFNNS